MPNSTIAVAGATGFVGSHIIRELLSRGHSVRGLVRSRDKARKVLPASDNLRLIEGDVQDQTSLAGLTAGVAGCINAIGIIREAGGITFKQAHIESTRALVAACRESAVRRFVLISALGVSDEGKAEYQRSKYEGEQILRRSDLDWTILRPSLIHGAGSDFLKLAAGWCRGDKQPWFFIPYFSRGRLSSEDVPMAAIYREAASIQPVAVEDVAIAAADSLVREDSVGEVINLVGPEVLTWPELLLYIRDHMPGGNFDIDPLGIPSEAAAIQAKVAAHIGIGGLLPFDEGMAIMGGQDSTGDGDKARLMLGLVPRPFRGTFEQYAAKIG